MTIRGSLGVDGAAEVELLDDGSGGKIEVGVDDLHELSVGLGSSTERVDVDGHRLLDTNGIRNLDGHAAGELGVNEGLGDPTASISSRAIDLGQVLSGEGTATVGAGSSVGINLELTSSDTGVSHGTSNDETSRGVQVVDALVVQKVLGDGRLDDVGVQVLGDLLVGDSLVVLGRDDDGVDTDGDQSSVLVLVLNGDLGLDVGAGPGEGTVVAQLRKLLAKLGGKGVSDGHVLGGLVSSITEHQTLVSSSKVVIRATNMDSTGNIGGLLADRDRNMAGLVVESYRVTFQQMLVSG